jgi:hypothetical protein
LGGKCRLAGKLSAASPPLAVKSYAVGLEMCRPAALVAGLCFPPLTKRIHRPRWVMAGHIYCECITFPLHGTGSVQGILAMRVRLSDAATSAVLAEHYRMQARVRCGRSADTIRHHLCSAFLTLVQSRERSCNEVEPVHGGGIILLGLVVCGLWGSPRHIAPKAQIRQELNVDPDLKLVTECSPYMPMTQRRLSLGFGTTSN